MSLPDEVRDTLVAELEGQSRRLFGKLYPTELPIGVDPLTFARADPIRTLWLSWCDGYVSPILLERCSPDWLEFAIKHARMRITHLIGASASIRGETQEGIERFIDLIEAERQLLDESGPGKVVRALALLREAERLLTLPSDAFYRAVVSAYAAHRDNELTVAMGKLEIAFEVETMARVLRACRSSTRRSTRETLALRVLIPAMGSTAELQRTFDQPVQAIRTVAGLLDSDFQPDRSTVAQVWDSIRQSEARLLRAQRRSEELQVAKRGG